MASTVYLMTVELDFSIFYQLSPDSFVQSVSENFGVNREIKWLKVVASFKHISNFAQPATYNDHYVNPMRNWQMNNSAISMYVRCIEDSTGATVTAQSRSFAIVGPSSWNSPPGL